MADPALGQKQICPNCQTKFYDLAKRPAHCPKCEFEFDPEEALKSRRARPRAAVRDFEETEAKPVRDEETEAFEEEAEATPEIDEAADEPDPAAADDDDAEGGVAAPAEPDADLGVDYDEEADVVADEEEEADDVPFLEDEDADIEGDDIALPGEDEEER